MTVKLTQRTPHTVSSPKDHHLPSILSLIGSSTEVVKDRKQLIDNSTESYSHICKENDKPLTVTVGNGLFPLPRFDRQ